jgi:hypothetical protein
MLKKPFPILLRNASELELTELILVDFQEGKNVGNTVGFKAGDD